MQPQPLSWCDPLALAAAIDTPEMALLHSSVQAGYSGRYSLLGTHLLESVDVSRFSEVAARAGRGHSRYADAWFCYLGYEMRHDCERYTASPAGRTDLPRGRMMRFRDVYVFDHEEKTLTLWSAEKQPAPAPAIPTDIQPPEVTGLSSNMTRGEYEARATRIIDEIHAGNLYQANLTRKFFGTWRKAPDGLSLFARLCRISPAPYSAYLRMRDGEVLSSSPELFLRAGADGRVTSRPIKGSAPRGKTPLEDAEQRSALAQSAKNRAENLMITDLMRNDLAKSCKDGSVEVSGLFDVTAHATIFHMASTVSGMLSESADIGTLLRGCFPPGSMTGAPKIRAVELCNELEGVERGIYSGAIGWLGGDGSAEFSVVIRTLIMQGERFEFQVGGGIVADSTPQGEWQETMDKSMGILKTLDISREILEAL